MFSFFLTTAGWWLWNGVLSAVYNPSPSIYAVRHGFSDTFGRDPLWWATLFGVLGVLGLVEMARRIAKRVFVGMGLWRWGPWRRGLEGLDVEVWQEMEKDPVVWERLKRLAAGEEVEDEEGEEGA
ncbi:hypothetical protein IMZ48_37265 [Candidatus Bathyarchaeota archaeon]|nr:hypothetical protein [Candidatus Bathyarchaeota archaeon]